MAKYCRETAFTIACCCWRLCSRSMSREAAALWIPRLIRISCEIGWLICDEMKAFGCCGDFTSTFVAGYGPSPGISPKAPFGNEYETGVSSCEAVTLVSNDGRRWVLAAARLSSAF